MLFRSCLEKKKGKHKSRHKPQPRKHKSRSRDRDLADVISRRRDRDQRRDLAFARSRSTLREIVPSIAIDALRDRAVDRDLDPARSCEGEIAINGVISRTTLREIAPSITISIRRDLSFSRTRALSLSLSHFFWKSFEVKMEVVIDFRGQRPFFWVNGFQFPENRIFRTNQTASFPEKHFRK